MWLASLPCLAADSEGVNCDPGLQPAGASEVGYASRGDRCEGLYVQEVSGPTLEVVSLTEESFKAYQFTKGNPLILKWPALGNGLVQLRATSVKRKLYYRMDTLHVQKPSVYVWPSDILSRLELRRAEIGVLGWTEELLGQTKWKIYLPLRIAPQEPSSQPGQIAAESYEVGLMSSVELQEVYVTLCPLDANGKLGKPLRKSMKLDYGYYPADRPITFRISFSELSGAPDGLYSLSVGAEMQNGDPVHTDICFFHPRSGSPWPNETGGKR